MKSLEIKPARSLEETCGPADTRYPITHVDDKQMPEINDWQVGKEYTIKMKVRMRSFDRSETIDTTHANACLDLLEYEPV